MRKLALPEEVLLQLEQPARYIGNEFNSVVKDKEKVALRGAFLFPDVYEIGMSHLGIQILYDMFNKREDMWCERVYSPWPDLDRVMREQNIPLFGLEAEEVFFSFRKPPVVASSVTKKPFLFNSAMVSASSSFRNTATINFIQIPPRILRSNGF